ncbi:MAG TPA: 3-hydroxy-3-methylglutaryl-CoA reductase, partial [Thermoanaerobaculia bacterium]|nr:3-hydroxy-3-methylglutaryl-CoA reductase [Thermoanaerobaculia bacterium]
RWISAEASVGSYLLFSGAESEKRASGRALSYGKGKRVVAGATLPAAVLSAVLHTSAKEIERLWRQTVVGHLAAGTLGYNGQLANLLTALFIACGQDVANVANSALGITQFEAIGDDALYASVTLPSLTVASVGGGTALPTAQDCLGLLHCRGEGGARRLAEIAAAAALAGELSMAGALASGEFAAAHEAYGRNYPREEEQT